MNNSLKLLIILVIVTFIVGIGALSAFYYYANKPIEPDPFAKDDAEKLPHFSSCQELYEVMEEHSNKRRGAYKYGLDFTAPLASTDSISGSKEMGLSYGGGADYSTTNVQVQGIDEADIVKSDGRYLYVIKQTDSYNLSGKTVSIVKAAPAEDAELIGEISSKITVRELFIHDDYLMLFGNSIVEAIPYAEQDQDLLKESYYYPRSRSFTAVELWNIKNKKAPRLERTIELEGSYKTARKIDGQVYFVVNNRPYFGLYENDDPFDIVPLYRDRKGSELHADDASDFYPMVRCNEIAYFSDVLPESFVTVASVSMDDISAPVTREVIIGAADNVYASFDNVYLADQKYEWHWDFYGDNPEYTVIHALGIDDGDVWYKGSMEAPGKILNQFSMDEHEKHFRIATTIGRVSRIEESTSTNNIYIFKPDMNPAGSIEDLAPGEKIYSARFMGDRAYLVTFKKIDPLFVFDLSDPENPEVLGKLKIPGYSDYLHPYDHNHIIGIGKETEEAIEGDFAWFQGLKMALFDVSDVTNPKEIHKVVIGDRGTDSYALKDHKAFLFNKDKNLLVLPIRLAEIAEERKTELSRNTYGQYTFQGSYVYNLTIGRGFDLQGRITHYDDDQPYKRYSARVHDIKRNLYIGKNLYSVSGSTIKINNLSTLEELKAVSLDMSAITTSSKKNDARRVSDAKQIMTALEIYYMDQDGYPVYKNSITLDGKEYSCLDSDGFGSSPCAGTTVYFPAVPADPGDNAYIYTSSASETYSLVFTLENPYTGLGSGTDCVASPNGISCK